jgi:hypothetical protein
MYTTTIMTLVTHTTVNISIRVHRRSLVKFMFRNLCFLCNDLSAIIFSPGRPLYFLSYEWRFLIMLWYLLTISEPMFEIVD